MGVYGVNWVRIGCMRCRDERLGGRAESWTDLCHPAFAMAGALAWQVKKISIKKVTCFGLEWRQHGSFLAQGLSSGVWCAILSLLCCLFLLYCSHTHLKSDSAQQRQRHISPPKVLSDYTPISIDMNLSNHVTFISPVTQQTHIYCAQLICLMLKPLQLNFGD